MKAFKCDRCGKFCLDVASAKKDMRITEGDHSFCIRLEMGIPYDLCPKCWKALLLKVAEELK